MVGVVDVQQTALPCSSFLGVRSFVGRYLQQDRKMPDAHAQPSCLKWSLPHPIIKTKENKMTKYIVAWLLGVPALLLIVIYFFMN